MNIELKNIEGVLNILIFGNMYKKNHIENFKSQLEKINQECIIVFFDAKILPQEIIKILLELSERISIKIHIAHKFLSYYFSRLKIQHTLLPNKSMYKKSKIKALVIGGSAGSLERILSILSALNKEDISIFVIQHILEGKSNNLVSILRNKSKYNVIEAQNNDPVNKGYIYIAPPSFHIKVSNRIIELTKDEPVNFARPSIDILFESLSKEYGSELMAILLSGYNDDGSHSLGFLLENKSKVLIQDPNECVEKELLLNAIKTNNYNYIFPLPELIHYVKRQIEYKKIKLDKDRISIFLAEILEKYGYDYRYYDYLTIYSLIIKEMDIYNIDSFDEFKENVLNYLDSFESLFWDFSKIIEKFFENPLFYKKIRDIILQYVSSSHIKIWCVGCATGEEVYSLAIMLKEQGLLEKVQIYATDINPYIIEQAKNGFFSKEDIEKKQIKYIEAGGKYNLKDYFDNISSTLQIKSEIKEHILFFQHSLVNQSILDEFDVIICRNVISSFDNFLKQKTIKLFKKSLNFNGFLILGEDEYVDNLNLFSSFDYELNIFRKSN
jgi:chemotaxis protein methyltransferase CheR